MAQIITLTMSLSTAFLGCVRPRAALILITAFLYLSIFPLFEIGPIEFSITTLPVLVLFLRALWQQRNHQSSVRILGWQWFILIGMVATAVLTVMMSEYLDSSFVGLFNFILYVLILFSVFAIIHTKDDFTKISKAILVCTFILAVYAQIQSIFPFLSLPGLGGVNGIAFKFYPAFSLCLIILAQRMEGFSSRWRFFAAILLNIIIIEAILYQTRSAWLTIVAISLLVIIRLPSKMSLWLGLLMISVIIGVMLRQMIDPNWQEFQQTVTALQSNNETLLYSDDRIRYVSMSAGWQMFLQRPLLGWGIDSFSSLIFQFASGPQKYITGGAFNSWLMLIVEQGIVGLLPVLAAFAFPLSLVWGRFRDWQGDERFLILSLVLGAIGIGIHLFFIDLMYSSFVWLHVGIAMASISLGRKALN